MNDRTPHRTMQEAIRQYVARESFKNEALDSWQAYRQTGRHLTGQEAAGWLASWGTGADAQLPKCHT